MVAAKIMTTDVLTLSHEDNLGEALALIRERYVRQVPVVDDHRRVVGVITPRALLRKILPGYITGGYLKDVKFAPELTQFIQKIEELANKKVSDLIDSNFCVITPETSTMEVAALFVNDEKPVESILVVDNMDRLLGIISPVDIFKRIWEFKEKKDSEKR